MYTKPRPWAIFFANVRVIKLSSERVSVGVFHATQNGKRLNIKKTRIHILFVGLMFLQTAILLRDVRFAGNFIKKG